jgi:hypothetical protein
MRSPISLSLSNEEPKIDIAANFLRLLESLPRGHSPDDIFASSTAGQLSLSHEARGLSRGS